MQTRRNRTYGSQKRTTIARPSSIFDGLTPTNDFRPQTVSDLMLKVSGKLGSGEVIGSFEHRIDMAIEVARIVASWVKFHVQKDDFETFKRRWKYGRCAVDLQTRLIIEQVLFEAGGKWRSLISGFGPL